MKSKKKQHVALPPFLLRGAGQERANSSAQSFDQYFDQISPWISPWRSQFLLGYFLPIIFTWVIFSFDCIRFLLHKTAFLETSKSMGTTGERETMADFFGQKYPWVGTADETFQVWRGLWKPCSGWGCYTPQQIPPDHTRTPSGHTGVHLWGGGGSNTMQSQG